MIPIGIKHLNQEIHQPLWSGDFLLNIERDISCFNSTITVALQ